METNNTDFACQLFAEYPPHGFSYNPNTSSFRVGSQDIRLEDYARFFARPEQPISTDDAKKLIDESALVLGGFHVQQMPRLTRWLQSKDTAQFQTVRSEVINAMIEAFTQTDTDNWFSKKELTAMRGDFTGFSLSLLRPGHPNFTVPGNCACMGPSPDGAIIFGEKYWNDGFAEYDLHNIDSLYQEIALLAGAGTLAHMCLVETT